MHAKLLTRRQGKDRTTLTTHDPVESATKKARLDRDEPKFSLQNNTVVESLFGVKPGMEVDNLVNC